MSQRMEDATGYAEGENSTLAYTTEPFGEYDEL